jgi:hypothetical protein
VSAPAVPPAAAPATPQPTPSAEQERFEWATRLEGRDPDAALRVYRELSGGDGAWAANGLFAAARLEAERGHVQSARTLLESYLRRFPSGQNGDDVRELLARLR